MPDPVMTWTIFALVWLAYLSREAYKIGKRHGRVQLLREQELERRLRAEHGLPPKET